MNPSFSCCLINDPFKDPGLYVEIRWARRALLFDLGENEALSPTSLLRTSDVFISHTHMDHFIGFDRLVRIALGRGKVIRLYGPPGLIGNVMGKLRGYTWNLVDGYPLTIEVREFHPHEIRLGRFLAAEGFNLQESPPESRTNHHLFPVLEDPMFTVRTSPLNHRIPSFAYSLQEQFHINVNKERLHAAGLPIGSWLKQVKQYIWEGKPDDFRFTATLYFEHRKEEREFVLGEIRDRFLTITRGQKIAYVVDAVYDEDNESRIVELARGADTFFCEAPFMAQDSAKAADRYHLTARQAGMLAGKAGVRQLIVFHFSPRYTGLADAIRREAEDAFREFSHAPSPAPLTGNSLRSSPG